MPLLFATIAICPLWVKAIEKNSKVRVAHGDSVPLTEMQYLLIVWESRFSAYKYLPEGFTTTEPAKSSLAPPAAIVAGLRGLSVPFLISRNCAIEPIPLRGPASAA